MSEFGRGRGVWCRRFGALVTLASGMAGTAATAAVGPGIGPATPPAGLAVNATGEVLYDSNELRIGDGAIPRGNQHRDDFRYSPALTASYGRNVGRLFVTANAILGRDFFQYNSYLSRNRYFIGGQVSYRVIPACQLVGTGSYGSRQNGVNPAFAAPVAESTAPDDVGVLVDNRQTSVLYGTNINCGSPTGRLSFGGGYNHSALDNASATRRFGNSISDTYSGNIGLGVWRPGQLSVTGSYTTIDYPQRLANVPPGVPLALLNTGVRSYRIGLSYSRPIGTRLTGTIGASYLRAEPSGLQPAYTSPAYNVALTYNSGRRLSLGLNGARTVVPSTTAGALYRVVDQIGIVGEYDLGQSIAINANAGLINNSYKQPFAIPGELLRRSDSSKTVGLGVTYAPRPLYDVRVNVNQTFRTADPSIFSYNSTRASITLAVHI